LAKAIWPHFVENIAKRLLEVECTLALDAIVDENRRRDIRLDPEIPAEE
jgi:hypothetical protein